MRSLRCLTVAGLIGVLALSGVTAAQADTGSPARPAVGVQTGPGEEARQLNQQDRTFLRGLHQGNLIEIASGFLALKKGTCAEVRRIGQLLIIDHTRLEFELMVVAVRHGVLLPPTPDARQQARLREVAALSGREFDLAWLRMQVDFHVEALQLIEQELRLGQSPVVKALARNAMPVVQHHLELVRAALITC